MFKIITQDGRTIVINRKHRLGIWTEHNTERFPELENALTVSADANLRRVEGSFNSYWVFDRVLNEVVGYFDTESSRDKVGELLRAAWKRGDSQFVVPQDNLYKSDTERLQDFADKHNLILASVNELGFRQSDIPHNLRIWKTSDYFERQNILVADESGSYETSLNKWKNLRKEAAA